MLGFYKRKVTEIQNVLSEIIQVVDSYHKNVVLLRFIYLFMLNLNCVWDCTTKHELCRLLLLPLFALLYDVSDLATRPYRLIFSLISSLTHPRNNYLFQLCVTLSCTRCCVDVAAALRSLMEVDNCHTWL